MYTEKLESLPKWAKILIFLFTGGLASGIFRVLRYLETKNVVTLVVGILCFFTFGFVFGIIDLFTEIMHNKVTILAD
jgi:hypothetical protein